MIELNLIYTDHPGGPIVVFENDMGRVWMRNSYDGNVANIAMNYYSAIKIKTNDSIFIVEPLCVCEQNYNINFLKQFRFIFTWATKAFENTEISNKLVHVNLPSYRGTPKIDSLNWPSWNERSDEVIFIANNKSSKHPSELYSLRIKLADWLHKNSKFKVSWYGNIAVPKPYYRGSLKSKFDILNKAKFHVCVENAYDPVYSNSYLSEKMPDAWFAGIIPVYMGCSNLDELGINKDCYLDLLPYRSDFAGLETILNNFSEQDYEKITSAYKNLSDDLYKLTSYDNVFEIMLKTYIG